MKMIPKVTLAVNQGWSPIGETIHTLINKIQNLNALNQADTKRVFLSPKHNRHQHPGINEASFNTKAVLRSTGWSSMMLQLSFVDEFPCLANIGLYRKYAMINSWHEKLRICPECFYHGVHLIFHQSKNWIKCPIHNVDLKESCISCGGENENFKMHFTREGFACNDCGFNPFSTPENWVSKKLEMKKAHLAASYVNWVSVTNEKIKVANKGKLGEEFIWITPVTKGGNLSSYYKLFGGPKWIGKCLEKHNKLVRHKLPIQCNVSRPRNSISATNIDRQWHNQSYTEANISTHRDIHLYISELRHKNTNCILELFSEAIDYVDQEIAKASPCLTSTNDIHYHKCIRKKYDAWYKSLSSITYDRGGISHFWQSWLAGPGRDFRINIYKLEAEQNKNRKYTIECTRIWMRTKLMEAARQHFSDKWASGDARIEEPKYLLKSDPMDGRLVLHEVRSNKTLKSILKDYVC